MSAAPPQAGSLVYVADPMCSWCYGFAPSLAAARARWPALPLRLLMGGLRPAGEPLDARLRAALAGHWAQVAARSGQPFAPEGLAREGWLYTTEPACRAVVVAREHGSDEQALGLFEAVQTAFYAHGRDTTDPGTLIALAQEAGLDADAFAERFDTPVSRSVAQDDFAAARRLGVHGFPTLLHLHGGGAQVLASGWLPPEALIERLASTPFGSA